MKYEQDRRRQKLTSCFGVEFVGSDLGITNLAEVGIFGGSGGSLAQGVKRMRENNNSKAKRSSSPGSIPRNNIKTFQPTQEHSHIQRRIEDIRTAVVISVKLKVEAEHMSGVPSPQQSPMPQAAPRNVP